ncbi:glycoside hydrolase domain-containing protein [Kitasatospora sp. NPDC096140]|uniref:glycoside hydrolase domain-containing protein n=1 Tax=Kitasatospora sp. NPDC096140 TaxID=3155425 RepID=UPI00332FFBC6
MNAQRLRAALTLGAALVSIASGPGTAHADTGAATRTVSVRGYDFQVPRDWSVVDLASDPSACVRFDRHTVYVGTPGTDQACPSHPSGRTEALLVEPQDTAATDRVTTDDTSAAELHAVAPKIKVTAAYGDHRSVVEDVLRKAGLAPVTADIRRPRAAAAPLAPSVTAAGAADTAFTGYGFDACTAPSSSAMSAWMQSSPYRAVGIYIGGPTRVCGQPNLSAGWVQQQAGAGWHFMPIWAGPQAASLGNPTSQGAEAANSAVAAAAGLGFGPGSTLYVDMENYASGYRGAVLSYLSAWSAQLHARGYRSGVYAGATSGIQDLADNVSGYTMPDVIWIARWNGVANTDEEVVPASLWANHQRIHQYFSDKGAAETYGGVTIDIDRNYLDVAAGSGSTNPPVMRVDTVKGGSVFDNQRNPDGSWSNAALLDGNGQITQTATTALPDGTFHVTTLANGKVYDNQRNTNGTWTGAALLDGSGQITAVSATGLADGTMHVQTLANGKVFDNQRNPDGTWSNAALLDGSGQITAVSATGLTDGTMHVQTLANGKVYDNQRNTNGSWTGAALLDGSGQITNISAAGLTDGTMHVQTLANGNVYDNQRNTNGTWTGAALLDGNGEITNISAAGFLK